MSRNKREGHYWGVSGGEFFRAWPTKRRHLKSMRIAAVNRKQRKENQIYNGVRIHG